MQRDERYHGEKSIKMILLGQDRGEWQFACNLDEMIFSSKIGANCSSPVLADDAFVIIALPNFEI
jgi:hypothetical protein